MLIAVTSRPPADNKFTGTYQQTSEEDAMQESMEATANANGMPFLVQRVVAVKNLEVVERFHKCDESRNNGKRSGLLPADVVRTLFGEVYGREVNQSSWDAFILVADVNHDGMLSAIEVQEWVTSVPVHIRRMGFLECVYVTFDDVGSCVLAKTLATIIMLLIALSSVCFVMETCIQFQNRVGDDSTAPEPLAVFSTIDTICVAVFTVEYLGRLLTVHMTRPPRVEKKQRDILGTEITTLGANPAALPWYRRTLNFTLQTMNLIDLVAILPFYVALLMPAGEGGGDFAVVRVLRMVRIFRVLKMGKYNEGMQMFGRVISNSMPALYLLAFYLILGIIIFGSMIFLAEHGTWHGPNSTSCPGVSLCSEIFGPASGGWLRLDHTGFGYEPTPFQSIPHAFWWVMVTVTTVGYGDYYPTSMGGKLIGCVTTITGILVLALPITIIGTNFSEEYTREKAKQTKAVKDRHANTWRRAAKLGAKNTGKPELGAGAAAAAGAGAGAGAGAAGAAGAAAGAAAGGKAASGVAGGTVAGGAAAAAAGGGKPPAGSAGGVGKDTPGLPPVKANQLDSSLVAGKDNAEQANNGGTTVVQVSGSQPPTRPGTGTGTSGGEEPPPPYPLPGSPLALSDDTVVVSVGETEACKEEGARSPSVADAASARVVALGVTLCQELQDIPNVNKRQQGYLLQEVNHISKQAVCGLLTARELDAFAVCSFGCLAGVVTPGGKPTHLVKSVRGLLLQFMFACHEEILPRHM